MTTSRSRMPAALLGAAVALAFTNAGAGEIDLSGGTGECGTTNGATVCSANDTGSTGSGTFPSFVGTNGGRPDTFFMYNTTNPIDDGNDVGNGNPKNRDVTLGDFAVTDPFGVDVFTFVLDINQVRTDPEWLLTLNHVSIFMGDGSLTGYDAGADTLGGVAATWAMSADDFITLNFSLAAGSGRGDMFLYVPTSLFASFGTDDHLQLFSSFGDPLANNDGFEEWSYLSCTETTAGPCFTPPDDVPEPGTLALLGLGLLGMGMARRRMPA